MPVDRGTLETKFPGVVAIGDVTGIMLTSIGKPLPKAGVLAHNEAEVVAHNIIFSITGKGRPRRFTGDGACFVETGDGLRPPGWLLHLGKVIYEKYWLFRWF